MPAGRQPPRSGLSSRIWPSGGVHLKLLYERPADSTSLADLGRTIGASARTLSRLFHSELGMTVYE